MALLIQCVIGATAVWLIWRYRLLEAMRKRLNRALFRLGYLLYANTRIGKWLNERNIRKSRVRFGQEGHTQLTSFTYGSLQIWPIPCQFDNYAYVVLDTESNDAVVIDAGDGATIMQFLEARSIVPKAILTTHKHWDHCDGNSLLKKQYPSIEVYGSSIDRPYGITTSPVHEKSFQISSLEFVALETPGHTKGHLVYLLKGRGSQADCLFTGDLLFLAGCGKLFEGAADEMLNSLDMICKLPDSTLIWPGHEYAVADLLFSYLIDPDDVIVQEKLSWAQMQRHDRLPTCPSTLAEEKQCNFFLRCGDINVLKLLNLAPSDETGQETDETNAIAQPVDGKLKIQAFMKLREKKDRLV